MASLLERKLIVVTGKGGAGKTTVACALGLLGARRGLRTIVVEFGDLHRLPGLFGHSDAPKSGVEVELEDGLWSISIDPDKALIEWLRTLGGRISVRMLAASSTFHYFAAAAPGAKELVSMVKVRELCEGPGTDERTRSADERTRGDARRENARYDLVVLDAPATGHALAMLRSPETFAAIVRVGPLAEQAQGVRELLEDARRSAYVAVTHAAEMAVSETLELEQGLRRHLDRDLDAVVVNGTLPRRFTREELERIAATTGESSPVGGAPARASPANGPPAKSADSEVLVASAARMARAVNHRARIQQTQVARLRRQRFAEGMPPSVVTLPFVFTPEIGLTAIRELAASLDRKL
ncbi:MAG: ArsA family ATPase [Solirubrobacteraceae bacterium]